MIRQAPPTIPRAGHERIWLISDNRIQERWARTDRWYRRFRHYLKAEHYPGRERTGEPDLLTVEDYALAFLLECLSIRDWFKECGAFTQQDVEMLYKDPTEACRDIANALKHMTLKSPGVDSNVQVDRAHMPGGSGLVLFELASATTSSLYAGIATSRSRRS